jgi:DNA-binding NarL/FixJ family response regulator
VFRAGIVATVESEATMTVVGETGALDHLLTAVSACAPNAVVVDGGLLDQLSYTRLAGVCQSHGAAVLVIAPPWSARFATLVARDIVHHCIGRNASRENLIAALHLIGQGKRAVCKAMLMDVGGPLPASLTTSELSVLAFAAEGLSNSAIASELRVSLPYVIDHVRRLRKKLGARDRTHAVTLGLKYGLLDMGRT